jgi:hypothetical protein
VRVPDNVTCGAEIEVPALFARGVRAVSVKRDARAQREERLCFLHQARVDLLCSMYAMRVRYVGYMAHFGRFVDGLMGEIAMSGREW